MVGVSRIHLIEVIRLFPMVKRMFFFTGKQLEIAKSIVVSLPIDVVNVFFWMKHSSKMIFHHLPMFKYKHSSNSIKSVLNSVPIFIESPSFSLKIICTTL